VSFDGRTRLFAVVGSPVEHSLSPAIHNFLFRRFAVNAAYVALPVRAEDFGMLLRGLATTAFDGLNVTTPHKERALRRMTRLSPAARSVGAVNTLRRRSDGFEGHNTDGVGLADFLEHEVRRPLQGSTVVVLGAGPAARAVVDEFCRRRPEGLYVLNRTATRFRSRFFRGLARRSFVHLLPLGDERSADALGRADVVVNGTTWGLGAGPAAGPCAWDLSLLPASALAVDMNYGASGGPTPFLAALPSRVRSFDGTGMLRWQATHAFTTWTGFDLDERDHRALKVHLDKLDRP